MCVYKTRVWSAWMMPCFICLKWSIYYRVTVINAQCMYQCAKYHFSVFLIIKVTWVTPNSNMKETCEKFIMIQCPQSNIWCIQFSQFTCSVMFYSLRPHGLQHASLPCPSPTPRAYSNSCPSIRWCHPTISSSVVPFSSHLQPIPESRYFPTSQLFISGGQSIGASASASVLPMNIRNWFPLGLTGLIFFLSKGLSA